VSAPAVFFEPALSPDGRSVAVSVGTTDSPRGDVWIFDTAGKDRGRRLTFGGVSTPAWTPDGQWVFYTSRDSSGSSIVRKRADGSGPGETLHVVPGNAYVDSVSPSASLLAFEAYDEAGNVDVFFLSLEGERKTRPFLTTPAAEGHTAFSPDGRLLAYASDESGLPQIYAKEISGAGSRWQLTTDGGDQVAWSADGVEIFYVGLDRVLRALPVLSTTPLKVGEPKPLFKLDIPALALTGNRTYYGVSPDRRRFLVNTLLAGDSAPGLRVVLNWRAPGGAAR
jgi:Tol biopolymer transport system component